MDNTLVMGQKVRRQRIREGCMAEGRQQQGQQQQGQQQQGQQQQGQQQQQLSPAQRLARALQGIRQVQNLLELNSPQQTNAIAALRESGDLVWAEIQRMQQQQQRQQ
jgi:hypothetical protein